MVEDQSDTPRVQIIAAPQTSCALNRIKKRCLDNCTWIVATGMLLSVALCLGAMNCCWRGCHPLESTPSCNTSRRASPVAEAIIGEKADVGKRRGKDTSLQSLGCEPILKKFRVRDMFSKFPRDNLQDQDPIWPEHVTATRCLDEFSYCGAQSGRCVAVEAGVRRRKVSVIYKEGGVVKRRKTSLEEHTQCACRDP